MKKKSSSIVEARNADTECSSHKIISTSDFPHFPGIDGGVLSKLLSGADRLRTLCLREIQPVDDALYKFAGTSLEMLNVSNTKVVMLS